MSILFIFVSLTGISIHSSEGAAGVPVRFMQEETSQPIQIFDAEGQLCGVGEYVQTISQGELVRVEIRLEIQGKSSLHQVVAVRQNKVLQPVSFFQELVIGKTTKRYEIDFSSGRAVSNHVDGNDSSRKTTVLQLEPSRTFAGVMFILVAMNFPADQSEIDLDYVIFTPEPKVIQVKMKKEASEDVIVGARRERAVKYSVRPVFSPLVKLVAGNSVDRFIWLSESNHPRFLRFQGSIRTGGPPLRIELTTNEPTYRLFEQNYSPRTEKKPEKSIQWNFLKHDIEVAH